MNLPSTPSIGSLLLLLDVDDDASSIDLLIHAVVVDHGLYAAPIFGPDLDTERIRFAVAGPDLELVFTCTIDRAHTLEHGVVTSGARVTTRT